MRKQRPINSCEGCRRRRIRCDKVRPTCGKCFAMKTTCCYTGKSPSADPAHEHDPPRTHPSHASPALPLPPLAPPEVRSIRPENVHDESRQPEVQHQGRLLEGISGRSTYLGPTFWANTISPNFHADTNVPDVRPFARWPSHTNIFGADNPKVGRHSRNVPSLPPHSPPTCKRCGNRYGLRCLLSLLPPRDACDALLDLFFSTVFTLTPILHLPMFAADHDNFWQAEGARGCDQPAVMSFLETRPTFLALYFSILFAAVKSSSQSRIERLLGDQVTDVADLYFAAIVSIALTGFPRRPSLYSLAAFVFVQSQLMREEEFSDTHDFIATAYRVALSMGLHRESRDYGIPGPQAEMRRRLWWHIIHLDVMASTSSGLSPLFLDELMTNTALMSEYEDSEAVQRDPKIDSRYLVAICRYRCTGEVRRIIRSHFDDTLQSSEQIKEILLRLDTFGSDLHRVIKSLLDTPNHSGVGESHSSARDRSENDTLQLPKAFDHVWSMSSGVQIPAVAAFRSWAALLLHIMLHKAYIVLYQPLFRASNATPDSEIRRSAVKHSQVFVHLFLRLCRHRACEQYRWMYPGTYQPLQALSILLADLIESPHSDHASESRGLVDATFELYEVDEGIVNHYDNNGRKLSPYGREAWSLLLRTRRKALEQVGKDPHVLLPGTLSMADECICGEESSLQEDIMQEASTVHTAHRGDTGDDDMSIRALFEPGELDMPTMENQGFDWDEWDLRQGNAAGVLA